MSASPLRAIIDDVMEARPAVAPPHPVPEEHKKPQDDTMHEALVAALASDEFFEDWVAATGHDFEDSRPVAASLRETSTVRADAVRVVFREGRPALAVVIEVQLRPDPKKFEAWRKYLCRVSDREHCPSMLLVVCADPKTERWAEDIFDHLPFKAPGVVLSAGNIHELVPDSEGARALLWAAACKKAAGELPPEPYLEELLRVSRNAAWRDTCYTMLFESFDPEVYEEYIDMETARLFDTLTENPSPNAKRWMERFTEYARRKAEAEGEARGRAKGVAEGEARGRAEGVAEGEARGRAEGEARGRAEGEARGRIFTALELRGLDCSPEQRAQIEQESELQVLKRWGDRAMTAASVAAVLGDPL